MISFPFLIYCSQWGCHLLDCHFVCRFFKFFQTTWKCGRQFLKFIEYLGRHLNWHNERMCRGRFFLGKICPCLTGFCICIVWKNPVETHWPKIMQMTHLVVLSISVQGQRTDTNFNHCTYVYETFLCFWWNLNPVLLHLSQALTNKSRLIVIKGLAHWRELMDLCHSHVYHSHYLTSNTYKTVFFTLPFLTIFSHFYVP